MYKSIFNYDNIEWVGKKWIRLVSHASPRQRQNNSTFVPCLSVRERRMMELAAPTVDVGRRRV